MNEPLVSIILSNYNGLEHLEECFNSLYNMNYNNFEIIFVDNNSNDSSVEFVRNNYKKIKIIQNKVNFGYSKANNIAASHSKGEFLVLLNIDTVVDENWLKELVNVAISSKEIGIVVSKILVYDNESLIDCAGGFIDKYGETGHINNYICIHKYLELQREVFYSCGAAMLIKREVYRKIGLYDELYYAYFEDVDLCWRSWIAGYKVVYVPTSFIYHKISKVISKQKDLKLMFLRERNRLRTLLKNYQIKTYPKILPIYIKKRISIVIKNSLKKHISRGEYLIDGLIKTIFWNIFHLKSLIKERKFIKSIRKKDDKYIFTLMKDGQRISEYIKFKKSKYKI